MLFCIVTFNLWLHFNKLLTYLLTYLHPIYMQLLAHYTQYTYERKKQTISTKILSMILRTLVMTTEYVRFSYYFNFYCTNTAMLMYDIDIAIAILSVCLSITKTSCPVWQWKMSPSGQLSLSQATLGCVTLKNVTLGAVITKPSQARLCDTEKCHPRGSYH